MATWKEDNEAGMGYLLFNDRLVDRTVFVNEGVAIDYDDQGKIVGIEVFLPDAGE